MTAATSQQHNNIWGAKVYLSLIIMSSTPVIKDRRSNYLECINKDNFVNENKYLHSFTNNFVCAIKFC